VTNLIVAIFQGLVGAGAAALPVAAAPISPVGAAGVGALVNGIIALIGGAINNGHADQAIGPTDFSILALSDARAEFKSAMLTGLDLAHNATFSNSLAGTSKGPEVSFFDPIY
jgi:hypothetical protein